MPLSDIPFDKNKQLAALAKNVNQISSISGPEGNSPMGVDVFPHGTSIYFDKPQVKPYTFKVCLVDTGPAGEADLTGYNYWAREVCWVVDSAGQFTMRDKPDGFWGPVINPGEILSKAHNLTTQEITDSGFVTPLSPCDVYKCSYEEVYGKTRDTPITVVMLDDMIYPIFHGQIASKIAINGAIRWAYIVQLGHWDMFHDATINTTTDTGGQWVSDPGSAVTAYVVAEDLNTFSGSGTIGTGNTAAKSDGTINSGSCKLLPLPIGSYVVMVPRGSDKNANQTYTIIAYNSAQ